MCCAHRYQDRPSWPKPPKQAGKSKNDSPVEDEAAAEQGAAEEPKGIDEDTVKMLDEQVKKGKERKFVVIYKGARIKKLIVFRKGSYKSKINQAKKEGFRGTPLCGTINGSGMGLKFRLAGTKEVSGKMGVDNVVTDDPIKKNLLKKFLAENKLKRKPEFEIVESIEALENTKSPGKKSPSAIA